jgi:F-type H+-transporting ATPase subunit delta
MRITRRARREARRLYRASLADGRLDEDRARKVAQRIARGKRRGSLAVLAHFRRLVALDERRHQAVVTSAGELPADIRARVEAGLARTYGPSTKVTFEEDPTVIGGMRVTVGSDVYDGTVRTALAVLQERFH